MLFARFSVHGVSTNQIAAQLGLSGPALYRHSESKDAILAELLLRDGAHKLAPMLRAMALAALLESDIT